MNPKPLLSIVIPLLNEQTNIEKLYTELLTALDPLTDSYEIIFVDDGSKDNSLYLIKELADKNSKIFGLSFSRNFGHQIALMAGMEHARGEWVLTMDADLQHPPSLISELCIKLKEGNDVVNTRRRNTKGVGFIKRSTSKNFTRFLNMLTGIKVVDGASDFRLMKREFVDAFIKLPERDRFTRGLVTWLGFRQVFVEYDAPERFSGETKYSYMKMLRYALDAITSFSSKPLRISLYLGMIVITAGFFYGIYATWCYFSGITVPGWTSLLLVILILGGFQLISLGVIGEYIGRIFNESKARSMYVIKERVNDI
ncbi:MAG: glycosyltransferase family 2 protein [Bacteroidetes bacterium]|nr:glycosyltransferase family 2 protein [Bacteroidota bacterium]